VFREPANSTHRQYEALRAFFVEGVPGAEAAARFGYTPGSFRVLVHQFRQDPQRAFFVPPAKGPQAADTRVFCYAKRMIIENNIEDGIDFFHMDALSSAVAMKVNCDLQLTLMASSLYRLLALQIGNGYETSKSRHLFRDFVDATAQIIITEDEIQVQFQKRARNPLLLAADFDKTACVVPWLGKKRLRLIFG